MYWNAAYYNEHLVTAPGLQLAAPLSTVPLKGNDFIWMEEAPGESEANGGGLSSKTIGNALSTAGNRKRQRDEFWEGILKTVELDSHRIVCGGRRATVTDQVRGENPAGRRALLELVGPLVLKTLAARFQSIEDSVYYFSRKGAKRVHSLGEMAIAFVTSGRRPLILFLEHLRPRAPRLLLPLGGHISNSLVELQLRETQNARTFRVVANRPGYARPFEVTTENEVAALRAEKRRLLDNRGDAAESVVLDPEIRYEIWSGDRAIAQPHLDSSTTGYATDSLYVLFTRLPGRDEAVLSVQPLHALGLSAMSLFHSPRETLGADATAFRLAAKASLNAPGSTGFEAILRAQRKESSRRGETPRDFEGEPTLRYVNVSMQEAPRPLIEQ